MKMLLLMLILMMIILIVVFVIVVHVIGVVGAATYFSEAWQSSHQVLVDEIELINEWI